MKGTGTMYNPENYAERQAANDASRSWAHRDRQRWTATDDAVLMENWVQVSPEDRDERQVSRDLQRTIEACRNRAHYLAGVHTGVRYNKKPKPLEERYDWMTEWESETGSGPIQGW